MKKKIISLILALTAFAQTAYASVLGSVITSWSHEIADGTDFYKNTFLSEQSGVGKQAEYYAEYTPNENVVPTVVSGATLWGLKNIKQAEQYMRDNGMIPLIGINASFFSWQTGLAMGHIISDGEIKAKDTESYRSIGFRTDGSAFISDLAIKTTLLSGDTEIDIAHINKYNQPSMDIINLYTGDFAEHTHTEAAALYLILGEIDGELSIGKKLTAVVEEKFNYTGSIQIPKNKIVLALNETGKAELYEQLNTLEAGDEITIVNTAETNSGLWETAVSALGSVGATLIKDGEVQSGFEAGAAPRTAVGITESGNVIFYVIDGRQKPYSYGVQTKTLAKRMKELGCVEAINLDGGGSTAISGIYPGTDESAVLNSPSEGTLRSCSNYLFLRNAQKPTGTLGHLCIYPFEQHYLSGYSETLYPAATDTAYYKTKLPDMLEYSVSGTDSTISADGVLTAAGDGEFTVSVSDGNVTGSAKYRVYKTPTNIKAYSDGNEITELALKKGDTVKLEFAAQYYYIDLKSSPECYDVSVTEGLGYVNDDGGIIITSDGGNGDILISAGEYTKKIPVTVEYDGIFKDTSEHWARDTIKAVYLRNIVSGYEMSDGLYFKPDDGITRGEFAAIVCRYLEIDTSGYSDCELLVFDDAISIPEWEKPYVAAAYYGGLMTGKTVDGEKMYFAPGDVLTRAEAVTILGRTEGIPSGDGTVFADSAEIPGWAEAYVSSMAAKGYISGYEDGTVRPNGAVTRAEAVTIISKMLNE